MQPRTIVVGDIHGCFGELGELLSQLDFRVNHDRLISVGDMINKGPRSVDVLRFFASSNSEAVLGNHELAFLRAIESKQSLSRAWQAIVDDMGDEKDFWISWLRELPLFIEDKDFIVVHAGLRPDKNISDTSARVLTSIRRWDGTGDELNREGDPPWFELYEGDKLVIHGHWAAMGLVERPNSIGLDSGCVYGKSLSALVLPERRIESVPARETYCEVEV
jgi:bis(5'-nucleosyl)-tetraphosphatase (symmetrical)